MDTALPVPSLGWAGAGSRRRNENLRNAIRCFGAFDLSKGHPSVATLLHVRTQHPAVSSREQFHPARQNPRGLCAGGETLTSNDL